MTLTDAQIEHHRARRRAEQQRYVAANREMVYEKNRAYYAAHRDELNAARKARYAANRERERENARVRAAAKPGHTRRWREANRERARAHVAKRNAQTRGAAMTELIDRDAIIARDKQRCHICSKRVPKHHIHLDHIVPLAAGGSHTATNLAVAHAFCNLSKGSRAANDQLRLIG